MFDSQNIAPSQDPRPYSGARATPTQPGGNAILLVGRQDAGRADLAAFFLGHGFRVLEACDRWAMHSILQDSPVDVIVLDDSSVHDGLELCRELATAAQAPVLMIADCEDHTDRVIALEVGADDVLGRPYHSRELLARVRALLRRSGGSTVQRSQKHIDFSGWRLNEMTRELRSPSGKPVPLAAAEYNLLKVFLSLPGTIITAEIVSTVLQIDMSSYRANFRTSVCRLRRKLGRDASGLRLLRTVHGQGYVLDTSSKAQLRAV